MYSFKQFSESLFEVRLITQTFDYGKSSPTAHDKDITHDDILSKNKKNQKLSKTSTGHVIYKMHEHEGTVSYAAHNPKTKRIDMWVNGKEKMHKNGTSTFKINGLSGRVGSTLKAHKLYGHLIRKHGVILHAKEQTIGGMKTWQKLQKERGVTISNYNKGKVSPLEHEIGTETTHITDNEIYGKRAQKKSTTEKQELKRTYHTNLIAHAEV